MTNGQKTFSSASPMNFTSSGLMFKIDKQLESYNSCFYHFAVGAILSNFDFFTLSATCWKFASNGQKTFSSASPMHCTCFGLMFKIDEQFESYNFCFYHFAVGAILSNFDFFTLSATLEIRD